jgi:hypothetical protein
MKQLKVCGMNFLKTSLARSVVAVKKNTRHFENNTAKMPYFQYGLDTKTK